MVRASALQSVNLGLILLVESYQKTLKNGTGIYSFPAWRLAFMGCCGEQACLLCSWARHLTGRTTFVWKTGDPKKATPKRLQTFCPKHSDTSLSRKWRTNIANQKKTKVENCCNLPFQTAQSHISRREFQTQDHCHQKRRSNRLERIANNFRRKK